MYADAMKLMQQPSLKDLWPRVGILVLSSDMYADAMKLMQPPSLKDLCSMVGILVFSVQTCMLMP